MAYDEIKSSGVTESTPGNILFGAGTFHVGLAYDSDSGEWNFSDSVIGATTGGGVLTITPEITNLEVDGALVKMKGLAIKTGETATIQTTLAEITPDILKNMLIADEQESEIAEGYNELVSRDILEDGDYLENFAYVGKRIDGTPLIILFEQCLCATGFSATAQNKTVASSTVTFECYADLQAEGTSLPYHIIYPAS